MATSTRDPIGYAVVPIYDRGYGGTEVARYQNNTCRKVALLATNITGITLLAVSGSGNGNIGTWVAGGIISLFAVAGDLNLVCGKRIIGGPVGDCLDRNGI